MPRHTAYIIVYLTIELRMKYIYTHNDPKKNERQFQLPKCLSSGRELTTSMPYFPMTRPHQKAFIVVMWFRTDHIWVYWQWYYLPVLPVPPNLRWLAWIHDVQFSCAINQPLLAHHWRVHQCLLTSRFIAPSIPWGVSAPGGKMLKQPLKDHNFLNNSPIFVIESSTFNIFAFQKALHTIHFCLKSCFGFGERYLTP